MKRNKGVTLIALVVTIVVLLILATISITSIYSENGILKQAKKTKNDTAKNIMGIDKELNAIKQEYEDAMAKNWDKDKVTAIDDGKGNEVPLPKGFYYVGGDIDTGIVISDIEGDTMDAKYPNSGNQFVWIPVKSEADLIRTKFDETTGKPISGLDTNLYTEPYSNGYATEEAEYNTMKTQVLKYGGFYIGRYEAGVNTTQFRTGKTEAQTVVIKKGVAPYNYIPWGNAMNDIGNATNPSGAVHLAKNFATKEGYTSVTSTLCYSSQWDAMCRYIENSQRTTAMTPNLNLTGNVPTDVSKNIYDLAGNCAEWVMEAYGSDARMVRGCLCTFEGPISYRAHSDTTGGYYEGLFAFRCTLYINE